METEMELAARLRSQDDQIAYGAFQQLLARSRAGDGVYPFLPQFCALLEAPGSYQRVRGLLLLCANARWDETRQIDNMLPSILHHLQDPKPTVVRQLLAALPELASGAPHLAPAIRRALAAADWSAYRDTVRPLLEQDRQKALRALEE